MRKCTKNILKIFGSLLILAILFVPYYSTHVKIKNKFGPYSGIKEKTTSKKNGYMFVFQLLKKREVKSDYAEVSYETYSLNTKVYITEIAIIIFLAVFDYFIFCILLKKKVRRKDKYL